MSAPSGKPDPIDLSAYEPRRARERVAAAPHPSEDKTDPLRSPYAPKRAHEPVARGGNLSKMAAIRFGPLTRR